MMNRSHHPISALLTVGVFALVAGLLLPLGPQAGPGPDPALPRQAVAGDQVPPDWEAAANAAVQALEYRFSTPALGEVSAPNRNHGLRSRIDDRGLQVESRLLGSKPDDGGWEFGLRLVQIGRGETLADVGDGTAEAREDRAEIRRPGITEWFINDVNGLEHGFELATPPEGDDGEPLVLVLKMNTNLAVVRHEDGRGMTLRDGVGSPVLRYDGLQVWDAGGRVLDAVLVVAPGSVSIVVDDDGAIYPLTVDPLLSTASTILTTDEDDAKFGHSVAPAGDTNADGYSDILVGAPFYDGGTLDQGRAFLFLGGPGGLSTSPQWEAEVGGIGSHFGWSVAAGGNLDGGRVDLLVGAPGWTNGSGDEGGVFMFSNPGNGFTGVATILDVDWSAEGGEVGSQFGYSVAGSHDVNGDGYDEVLVGAPFHGGGAVDGPGAVFLYEGSSSGMGSNGTPANADWRADGSGFSNIGQSVAYAGDVNADGYVEVLAGAPGDNEVHLWLGSSTGLGANGTLTNADWRVMGGQLGERLGTSVATAGDVNGDGYADIIIGGSGTTSTLGRATVWLGSGSGLSGSGGTTLGADFTTNLGVTYRNVNVVAPAGDVNGDGYADVAVGASGTVEGGDAGVFVWYGGPGGLGSVGTVANADWFMDLPDGTMSILARWLQGGGDVDGNGVADLLVGHQYDDSGTASSRVSVYPGTVDGPSTSMTNAFAGNQSGDKFGAALAAGDINQDGFIDLVVGAPGYDGGSADSGRVLAFKGTSGGPNFSFVWTEMLPNFGGSGRMGSSMVLKDQDGDGYADLLVGVPGWSGSAPDGGAVLYYPGSITGLPDAQTFALPRGTPGGRFGEVMVDAGDTNGDGLVDLLVGEPGASQALLFLGDSFFGFSGVVSWTGSAPGAPSDGMALAAGDFNGDGFSDVAIGLPGVEAVEIYHGGGGGLSAVRDTLLWLVPELNLRFGGALASGGDVNGDGYDDLLVGVPKYSNPFSSVGRAQLHLGGPDGVSAVFSWSLDGTQAFGDLGESASMAGDVNADGYADILIGEPGYNGAAGSATGRAHLFLGSAAGPAAASAWSVEGNSINERLGSALLFSDMDGNGLADPVVGEAASGTGQARLFFGGGIPGRAYKVRQRQPDESSYMARHGKSVLWDQIRIVAHGFALHGGKQDLTLRVEARDLPLLFGDPGKEGKDTNLSVTNAGGRRLEATVWNLTSARFYRWRARVESGSPWFPWGPWLSLEAGGATRAAFRTSGCIDEDGDGFGFPGDLVCSGSNFPDNCPLIYNPIQEDADDDGIGDACDPDVDGDGVNEATDNCPGISNPGQEDMDGDGEGDVCDVCPTMDNDIDNDGLFGPCAVEPGWSVGRIIDFADGTGAHYNPVDGLIYVGRRTGTGRGLYRIEANDSATALWTGDEIIGLAFDPVGGHIFTSDDFSGEIFRTDVATGVREVWVSGLHDGDDDPVGLAIAPPDYSGTILAPGQGLLVDRGSSGLDEVWFWDPAVKQAQGVIHADDGTLSNGVDITIDSAKVWVVDTGSGADGILYELQAGGGLVPLSTSEALAEPAAIDVDPADGNLLVLEGGANGGGRRVVRVDPVSGAVSEAFIGFQLIGIEGWAMMDVSPDGSKVLVTDRGNGRLYEFVRESDGDGVPDSTDNCPDSFNPFQDDGDGDGWGDACEICPGTDDDVDGDGIQGPCIVEAGWILGRTVDFDGGIAAHYSPVDGMIYLGRRSGADRGLYRIEADDSATALWTGDYVAGVAFDPVAGHIFTSDDFSGEIFRTDVVTGVRTVWVSGLHDGDDDPVGLAIAPSDYSGTVLAPGQGLLVDRGSSGLDEVWLWDPAAQQVQSVIHADDGTLSNGVDITIDSAKVWVVDTGSGGDGILYEVQAGGGLVPLATSEVLKEPAAIDIDPVDARLLVLEGGSNGGGNRVVRVDPVNGAVSEVFTEFQLVGIEGWARLDVSPDGFKVLVTDPGNGRLYEFVRESDGDGVPDEMDNCPAVANAGQEDDDLDGWGDACDCDPNESSIYPGAPEFCNGVDDDCDFEVDEPGAVDGFEYFADGDMDGYGDPFSTQIACPTPAGYVTDSSDCDDTDASINPDATEVCGNGVDDNCNGVIDDGFDDLTWYEDQDGDTWGNPAVTLLACAAPAGHVIRADDCNDTNANTYPGAVERNDGQDNHCPGDEGYGQVDEMGLITSYLACSNNGLMACDPGSFNPLQDCGDTGATCASTTVCWTVQFGTTLYQFATASTPDFTGGCTVTNVDASFPCAFNVPGPLPGEAIFMDVRALAPFTGEWGQDSGGVQRTVSCAP